MLAVITFILLAFVFAAVVAFVVAMVMAHARHALDHRLVQRHRPRSTCSARSGNIAWR